MSERDEAEYLWDKRHAVLYRAELSVLYHRKRERFFAFWERAVTAVAIIGGSAAFANIGGADVVKWVAAIIAVTSTVSLVFGFGTRARTHAGLAERFLELEARIVGHGERDFTEADIGAWESLARMLEMQEPATMSSLVRVCQNELARARGDNARIVPLNRWRRLTMHFLDHAAITSHKPA